MNSTRSSQKVKYASGMVPTLNALDKLSNSILDIDTGNPLVKSFETCDHELNLCTIKCGFDIPT